MYKLKLGVSVASMVENHINVNFEYQIKKLKRLGFDSIDLNAYGCRKKDVFLGFLNDFKKFADVLKENDMILNAIHMPFGAYGDLSTPDEKQRLEVLDVAVQVFSVLDTLKPNYYVFHGSGDPIPDNLREQMLGNLVRSLNYLTDKTNVQICIENLPRTCLLNTTQELNELLKKVPKVCVCLDTNHFLTEKTEDAILKIGNVIKTTHVSDFDYIDEKHWLPTQGSIDWQKVIGALEKIGYNGVFNYELCSNYDYEQIKENYDKLFNEYNK